MDCFFKEVFSAEEKGLTDDRHVKKLFGTVVLPIKTGQKHLENIRDVYKLEEPKMCC